MTPTGRFPLSVSKYEVYTECPAQFRLVYPQAFGDQPVLRAAADITAFGRIEHEAIEFYIRHLLDTKQASAPQDVDRVWLAFVAQRDGGVPPALTASVLHLLRQFAGRHRLDLDRVWRPEAELAVTHEGKPTEWFARDVFLRSKLDLPLVDGWDAQIIDWKCLDKHQELRRADGSMVRAGEVRVGDRLLAWDGQGFVPDAVVAVGDGGVQPCVDVTTVYGRRMRVSANHPVLVASEWREAGALRPGDPLRVCDVLPTGACVSADEARLLGYLIADGGLARSTPTIAKKEPAVRAEIETLCCRLGFTFKPDNAQGRPQFCIGGATEFVRRHGLQHCGARDKRVPPAVMASGADVAAAFLSGYLDGDGHVHPTRHEVTACTISDGLAADLHDLLWRLGVKARLWKHDNKRVRGQPYDVWYVAVSRHEDVAALARIVALACSHKRERLAGHAAAFATPPRDRWGRTPPHRAAMIEAVAGVTPLPPQPTVAITMATHGTFVTSGIVTHNTGWAVAASDQAVYDDLQARTYAMMLNLFNPAIQRVRVTLDFVRFDIRRSAVFELADFTEAWAFWLAASEGVEAALAQKGYQKLWAARPGPHCSLCEVAVHCPVAREPRAEIACVDAASAQETAAALVALDALRGALTKQLKAWVDGHGPVDVNGLRYQYWKTESYAYEVYRFIQLAKDHGVEYNHLLTVSREELKKVAKKHKAFVDAVDAIKTDRSGTRFEAKKWEAGPAALPPAPAA